LWRSDAERQQHPWDFGLFERCYRIDRDRPLRSFSGLDDHWSSRPRHEHHLQHLDHHERCHHDNRSKKRVVGSERRGYNDDIDCNAKLGGPSTIGTRALSCRSAYSPPSS
jgi:hypothetical protein